ncbi:MAG: aminoacyl--tRNA ligase-related protein [Patescibacteria group bacterium]
MRQSHLFTRTRREAPKDETAKNAQLLIRAGFIQKMQAGVYSYLPLGERVIERIKTIIRDEMNAIGGQEVSLASLQEKEMWTKTGRWDDAVVDNWFKTKLKNDTELGLGFTHEEPLSTLLKDHIRSFRDLPAYIYQFQTKFRNEKRAKSGILRGREFLMKDLYSFSATEDGRAQFYEKVKEAYVRIFRKAGIGDRTFVTFASGGSFAQFSHEFQMLTDAGEDIIYVNKEKGIAVNQEVYNDDVLAQLNLKKDDLVEEKAVEVGNIFNLGTKFSEPLELMFQAEDGSMQPVIMGSYGIGVPRLMGAIVEACSDEKGIVWPRSVAPFDIHLIHVSGSDETASRADKLYRDLQDVGFEVLYDDRALVRAGEKFADADLIGLPTWIVVSDKNMMGDKVVFEVKDRKSGEVTNVAEDEILVRMNLLRNSQ